MQISIREKAKSLWHVQRVKGLIRQHLGGSQCIVSVRETICTDPGCEGPATEIRIVTLACQEMKTMIHKSLSEIESKDIAIFV